MLVIHVCGKLKTNIHFEGLCWNGSSLLEWTVSFDLDRCHENENQCVTVKHFIRTINCSCVD